MDAKLGRSILHKLGWFSTARGPSSRALLRAVWEAVQRGELDAQIAFVFCNREQGESAETDEFLAQVKGYGLPLVAFSFDKFRREHHGRGRGFDGVAFTPWREAYDQEVLRRLQGHHIDLAVLAGYMLVMTPALSEQFPFINLHPALPGGPIGTWQQVIWELIDKRAATSGMLMHVATPDLDRGPVVTYCSYALKTPGLEPLWQAINGRASDELKTAAGEALPLFQAVRKEGAVRELPFILATLKAFCSGGLRVQGYQVVDKEGMPASPQDLTEQVEAELRKATPSGD